MDIISKSAIVTGSSRGIGRAITEALLKEGVTVIGWNRTKPNFQHERFHAVQVDIADANQVDRAFEETTQRVGDQIPILVNNAGIGYKGATDEMDISEWQRLFNINVNGLFYVTRCVIPLMKQMQQGHIINISSGAGTTGIAGMAAYCGTKHAVHGISHSLHAELRYDGIKVTCLSPGSVHSNFSKEMGSPPSKTNKMRPEDIAFSVIHALKAHPNYHYVDMEVRPLQP
ncbi:MAG: SDR family oxidoreductase [Bacteroidota bacterium]